MFRDLQSDKSASYRSRKRVLIVNCFFDTTRRPISRTAKFPQSVGPIYLAGLFSRERCDVYCYSELASGPLEDRRLFAWPDMLVLTGLTNSFDRMLHLTAYTRSQNHNVIVVAGGPAVRALPELAKQFFDYACVGDLEEIRNVVSEVFGSDYTSVEFYPRYDLAYWLGSIGYIETSRNCNFHCTFCSLTGEGRTYQAYDLDYIARQILALGNRRRVVLIDNNFYGNDRNHFRARLNLLRDMVQFGRFKKWSALVTSDFFNKSENLELVKEAGCEFLFCGVESFKSEWLHMFNKTQNVGRSQVDMIKNCLSTGVVFSYGLMTDVTTRSIADIRSELDLIMATPEITLPSFITLSIPLLGTPYFQDSVTKGLMLPNIKLRDMDGTTMLQKPLDPIEKVVDFLSDDVTSFRRYRIQVMRHSAHFAKLYRKHLTATQLLLATGGGLMLSAQRFVTRLYRLNEREKQPSRTYVSTTEPLDRTYSPVFRMDTRFEQYFKPTMITDDGGQPHKNLITSGSIFTTKQS